jgi:ComF family protein
MKFIVRWSSALLTLLYPESCAACDASLEGAGERAPPLCAPCALSLVPIAHPCERCGLALPDERARLCLGCGVQPPSYAAARAPYEYGGALGRAIRRFKWSGLSALGRPLGGLFACAATRDVDCIVPVPLHPRRLRARGYNQAALLARALTRSGGAKLILDGLDRVRDTPSQATLGLAERRRNVRGAFVAVKRRVAGQHVLVIDDVLTTGATAEACARALTEAGAASVRVLTLARAMP